MHRVNYVNAVATVCLLAVVGGVTASALGAFTEAAAPKKITACVKKRGQGKGLMRLASKCRRGERRISWNVQGPAGPAGVTGAPGSQGNAGAPGEPGTPGAPGGPGTPGTPGAAGVALPVPSCSSPSRARPAGRRMGPVRAATWSAGRRAATSAPPWASPSAPRKT